MKKYYMESYNPDSGLDKNSPHFYHGEMFEAENDGESASWNSCLKSALKMTQLALEKSLLMNGRPGTKGIFYTEQENFDEIQAKFEKTEFTQVKSVHQLLENGSD